jgi:hypothetical protein
MPPKRRKKPTLYVDSNIVSVLCYRGVHLSAVHQHMVTKQWWETERRFFQLLASGFTEGELRRSNYPGQEEAMALVRRLNYLPTSAAVKQCAAELLQQGIVPANKPGDATQLAFATVYRADYLLTWNHAHLANIHTQRQVNSLCERRGWRSPLLVSPDNIPRVALGQTIRRPDDG